MSQVLFSSQRTLQCTTASLSLAYERFSMPSSLLGHKLPGDRQVTPEFTARSAGSHTVLSPGCLSVNGLG